MRSKISLATVAAAGALLAIPAVSQAALFIDAKSFSTQEATSLARSAIATFSDDHTPATPCDPTGYTSTVDWGDGTPVQPATVSFRFGGDFTLCEFTVNADHKYAHFGIYTTTVSVSGGPHSHSGSDTAEITVARTAFSFRKL